MVVEARVRYHILTDGQHAMLRETYGLRANAPYRFEIYRREFPLSEQLSVALSQQPVNPQIGCSKDSVNQVSMHGSLG